MAEREVVKVDLGAGGEFTVCPNCGYEDGFHSVFEGFGGAGPVKWFLICPRCSSKYDIGLVYKG
ncbi:MAG: hypothetical protein FVQ79_01135 [Planctomycetes bacterium]|nr:hypothetical protein [Planctomycetota bacterium]